MSQTRNRLDEESDAKSGQVACPMSLAFILRDSLVVVVVVVVVVVAVVVAVVVVVVVLRNPATRMASG